MSNSAVCKSSLLKTDYVSVTVRTIHLQATGTLTCQCDFQPVFPHLIHFVLLYITQTDGIMKLEEMTAREKSCSSQTDLGTMALVRRIAWRVMILGSWSGIGAPGGRHWWQPCSLIGVARWGDWYSSDRAAVPCIVCGGCSSRWWWRQWPTVIWIYTGGELWEGGRGRWGRGEIGHATILEIAWAIRASSVLLIIVNTAIETVTVINWWPLSIGACCSAAVPIPQLRAVTAKPTRGRRQPT